MGGERLIVIIITALELNRKLTDLCKWVFEKPRSRASQMLRNIN